MIEYWKVRKRFFVVADSVVPSGALMILALNVIDIDLFSWKFEEKIPTNWWISQ